MYKLVLLYLVATVDARLFFPLLNSTIPTAYLPADSTTNQFREAVGLLMPLDGINGDGNVTNGVVLIPAEFQCDISIHDAYRRGAIGAICSTSLRVLGSSYANFALKQPFSDADLISVDTYTAIFPNLTKLIGMNVTIDNQEGNAWHAVFTPQPLAAFAGVFVALAGILALACAGILIINVMKASKIFPVVYLLVLSAASIIILIGTIDYAGRMQTYGFWASFILTNLGIQMTFTNVWLYNLKVWELTSESVAVSNFVRYKYLFITLSIFTPALDISLAVASVFSPNPVWSLVRLVLLAAQMFACAASYITCIVRLKRFRANESMKDVVGRKERIDKLIGSCTSISVMLITRTSYAFISIAMFSSPLTVLIHYWIERAFAIYTVTVLLAPMADSTVRLIATPGSKTATQTRTTNVTGKSTSTKATMISLESQ
jgi:hypothetical protein